MILFCLISLFVMTTPLEMNATVSNPNSITTSKKGGFKAKIKNWKVVKKIKKTMADEKTAAIVSYLFLIGWLVSLLALHEKGNSLSAFHLRQTLGLMLVSIVLSIGLGFIPIVGSILSGVFSIVILIAWIMGLISAINEEEKPTFLFGKMYQEWFKGIE